MTITFFGDPFDLRGVYNPIYADNKGQEIKSSCPPLGDPFDLRGVYNPIYADNKGQEIKSSCPPLGGFCIIVKKSCYLWESSFIADVFKDTRRNKRS